MSKIYLICQMNFNYKVLLFPEDLQYSEDGEHIAWNSWHNFHIFHFIPNILSNTNHLFSKYFLSTCSEWGPVSGTGNTAENTTVLVLTFIGTSREPDIKLIYNHRSMRSIVTSAIKVKVKDALRKLVGNLV